MIGERVIDGTALVDEPHVYCPYCGMPDIDCEDSMKFGDETNNHGSHPHHRIKRVVKGNKCKRCGREYDVYLRPTDLPVRFPLFMMTKPH